MKKTRTKISKNLNVIKKSRFNQLTYQPKSFNFLFQNKKQIVTFINIFEYIFALVS